MRFATAIRDFSRRKGGAERYVVDLCTRMAKESHEVHVYAEHWEEETQGNPSPSSEDASIPQESSSSLFCH